MEARLAFNSDPIDAQPTERRTGLVLLVASAYPECNCPDDCDRDHPNE